MQTRTRLKSSIEFTPEVAEKIAAARMAMRIRGHRGLSASLIIAYLIMEKLDLDELDAWATKRAKQIDREVKREAKRDEHAVLSVELRADEPVRAKRRR